MCRNEALTVVWFALLLLCASASAQNLVSNPHFDTGLADWDVYGPGNGILLWSNNMDAGGSAVLGSASVGILPTTGNALFGISQCLPVEASKRYQFGGSFYLSFDVGTIGQAEAAVFWFDGLGCTGNTLSNEHGNILGDSSIGTWQVSGDVDAQAPATALSAQFILLIHKYSGDGLVSAYIDRAIFRTNLIFADDFESGNPTAWSYSSP